MDIHMEEWTKLYDYLDHGKHVFEDNFPPNYI